MTRLSKAHIELGKLGEQIALNHLVDLGFHILERNWRYKRAEIDIIASKEDILHFVEVKTRTSTKYGNPEEAISINKMRMLMLAAEEYQIQFPAWKKIQFDVCAILLPKDQSQEIFVNWDVYI